MNTRFKNHSDPNEPDPNLTIFIGLREISGYYTNLTRGLRKLGYRVIFVGGGLHPFRYGSEEERAALPLIPRVYENLLIARRDAKLLRLIQLPLLNVLIEVQQLIMFLWSLFTCDVFIFGYAHTFIKGSLDLIILHRFSKRVIVNIGHGSEARPPYLDGSLRYKDGSWGDLARLRKLTKFLSKRAKRIEKYASLVIASPYTSQFLTKPAIDFFAIGMPINSTHFTKKNSGILSKKIRIFHAPSKPIAKGSIEIRKHISDLQRDGFDIDFIEITGRPNVEVRAELEQCDLVIDQLYSDSPMTGIAHEAAEFSKPTLVAGYGLSTVAEYSWAMAAPPTIKCTPPTFINTLKDYLNDHDARIDVGQKAFEFVSMEWNQDVVAARYNRLIASDTDKRWIFNPRDIPYISGCALSTEELITIVSKYVAQYSPEGLEIDHRPDLKIDILNLIKSSQT